METIKIKAVESGGKTLWKMGRKQVGYTEQYTNGKWRNYIRGCSFSESDTKERAVWVMKIYLADRYNAFGNREVIFE